MARKSNSSSWFLKILTLSLLVIGLASGVLLVQRNQNPNENAQTVTWPDCRSLTDATSCQAWNCTWSTKYCHNFSPEQCLSYSSKGCLLNTCTMTDCTNGRQGCSLTGGSCSNPSGGGPCFGLAEKTCKSHLADWGCTWTPAQCSGSSCQYGNGSTVDPGFSTCTGFPSRITYSCDPNNVYVYRKNTCDGTACWYDTISCPTGQRCDLNSSTHCSSTRICYPGQTRCPLASGKEYSYFERCSSDGFRWERVPCPSGKWCTEANAYAYCS